MGNRSERDPRYGLCAADGTSDGRAECGRGCAVDVALPSHATSVAGHDNRFRSQRGIEGA